MSLALAPWPKEALTWASYELRLPIQDQDQERGDLAWGGLA